MRTTTVPEGAGPAGGLAAVGGVPSFVRARRRERIVLAVLCLAAVAAFLLAIALGTVDIPVDAVVGILLGETPERPSWVIIVHDVRLPRAVVASLAGAA